DWSARRLEWTDENGSIAAYLAIHLHRVIVSVMLYSEAKNAMTVYYHIHEAVAHVTFHSALMPNSRSPLSKTDVQSDEEFQEVLKEFRHQVRFLHFTYDKTHKRYYRFSQFFVNAGSENASVNPLLTVFDENFEQLYETSSLPVD